MTLDVTYNFAGYDWLVTTAARGRHMCWQQAGSREGFKDDGEKQVLRCDDELKFQLAMHQWVKEHPDRPIYVGDRPAYRPPKESPNGVAA